MDALLRYLDIDFFGNSLGQIAAYLGILIGAAILGRLLKYVLDRYLKRWAQKSSGQLDDILVGVLSTPLILGSVLGIANLGLQVLTLSEEAAFALSTIFSVLLTLVIAIAVANLYAKFMELWLTPIAEKSETKLDDQLFPIVIRGGKYVIIVLGIIIALSNAGYNIYSLLAGLGVGGIALAMAARETIAHAFGGVTIFTDRPFQIGDYIIVDWEKGHEGVVESIGLRSTRIQTRFDTRLVIPNAVITNQTVVNVSAYNNRRRNSQELTLSLKNSHAQVQQAIEIMKAVLEAHEEIDKYKVYFKKFASWGFEIKYRFWVTHYKQFYRVTGEINAAILERFEAEGIQLALTPLLERSGAETDADALGVE